MKPQPLLKETILSSVIKAGGWVNAHGHFDRAYTVTLENLHQAHELMEKKWVLVDDMKRGSSEEDYYMRIEQAVQSLISQGVTATATFIDIDSISELRAVKAAAAVRQAYKDKITIKVINQCLKGLTDPVERQWAERALEYVDIIGGLPSKDRPEDGKHLDTICSWAKETGKMLHVHIDQENNPDEHDTDLLISKMKQYHLEGRVVAIHAVSISAQPLAKRKELYKAMKECSMIVVCCPSAGLSMKQIDKTAILHNSIVPVSELVQMGVPVALGIDNISDIYQPLVDGDMYTELRMLSESNRYYDLDGLIDIATKNGRIALGI